jgi:hypothetical protein
LNSDCLLELKKKYYVYIQYWIDRKEKHEEPDW